MYLTAYKTYEVENEGKVLQVDEMAVVQRRSGVFYGCTPVADPGFDLRGGVDFVNGGGGG